MKIKRYYWTEQFDEESFDKFLQFQNELTEEDSFEVWLDSEGGNCITAQMLKELFESYDPEKFQLVGTNILASSALDLFVTVKCNKTLIPGTLGVTHTMSRYMKIDGKGNRRIKFSEEKKINNTYPLVVEFEKKLPSVLTDEEMRKYYENEDVWLSTEEIKKLLT